MDVAAALSQVMHPPPPRNVGTNDQFLQDLAQVVPSLSLPSMRGAELLKSITNAPANQLLKELISGRSTLPTPNAESLVAKSLLVATPSPFKPPSTADQSLTELNWDEEGRHAHWPVDDDAVFYRNAKLSASAEASGRRNFFDLNIVMPMVIPSSEIRVLNTDGENYYNLAATNPGAHLLFGRETRDTAQPTPAANEPFETDDDRFQVKPPTESSAYPAVCDIWASFLNIQLGVIRNCRGEQIVKVCQLFNQIFMEDVLANFVVPIVIDCKGIYRSPGKNFESYETHGVFLTENDRRRFRIIRRRLKRFILMLWEEFGIECDGPKFDVTLTDNCRTNPNYPIRIEIRRYGPLTHPELIRHVWQPDKIATNKNGKLHENHVFQLEGLPAISAQTRVVLNEVRLEMTHARMIDPRWPEQWVLARRMPAVPASSRSRPMLARHVFCNRVEMPKIIYEFSHPRRTLMKSRFAPLYLLADVARRDIEAAEEEKARLRNANKVQLNAAAIPFFPLSTVLDKIAVGSPKSPQQSPRGTPARVSSPNTARPSAWDRLVTSATLAGLPDSNSLSTSTFFNSNRSSQEVPQQAETLINALFATAPGTFPDASLLSPQANPSPNTMHSSPYRPLPITEEPCRFFQSGSCARGDACYFLHPADPKLETTADVRHLSPTNPIFF